MVDFMGLQKIIDDSPIIEQFGVKIAFYSDNCCWWTTYPEDLLYNSKNVPRCPHCRSSLKMAPLEDFLKAAYSKPKNYGSMGLDALVEAHSRNSSICHKKFFEYNDAIRKRYAK